MEDPTPSPVNRGRWELVLLEVLSQLSPLELCAHRPLLGILKGDRGMACGQAGALSPSPSYLSPCCLAPISSPRAGLVGRGPWIEKLRCQLQ